MFYVVGLGNPGEKYQTTRHNVGWSALDCVLDKLLFSNLTESRSLSGRVSVGVIKNEEVTVLYPNTFMNNSGSAAAKLVPKKEIEKLVVVHDDIDLPFGELKIVQGRGSGGNNGVQSIIDKLDSKEFVRVRIGIASKSFWTRKVKRPAGGGPLERFVLKPFSNKEQKQLPEVFGQVQKALEIIISDGVEAAMSEIN
ncbi:MAG: PTH1 family peptidyl-tRNA hydrolase [Candidatus Paceibacteria bacterium]|jgi:PTH1 family peptidyl-tRNA hydrolase